MDLLSPEPGLVIWTALTFLILLFMLKKFAWGPVLEAIKEREDSIENAVVHAQQVQQELKHIEVSRAQMEAEIRQQRDVIIKEAKQLQNNIVEEAKNAAKTEAEKILKQAREQITKEKQEAMSEMKAQVAQLSVTIASQILAEELKPSAKQEELIAKYLEEANFN